MTGPTCTYWASREPGAPTYTLRFVLSDDPGETIIRGCSRERCEEELASVEAMGYELVSGLRQSLSGFISC